MFIPGNSSSSKLLKHLSDNSPDTPSVLFESEMDTLSVTISSDYGNYSDVIRKTFHNEPVSQSRRLNNEYIDVECPKLAIILSGTPGQLFKFISNREDGLLSRFMVMHFNSSQGWQSVSPSHTFINLTDYFKDLSKEYYKMWDYISQDELEISLTAEQWEYLEDYCKEKYRQITTLHNNDATSLIKRHGIMLFKLCMTLTGIRKYEEKIISKSIICKDDDFRIALYLINESLYSSLEIYDLLPDSKQVTLSSKKDGFLCSLPLEFQRAEAIANASKMNICERTADRYLKYFISEKSLIQPVHGKYLKAS